MALVDFDSSKLTPFIHDNELAEMQAMVNAADAQLRNGSGAGSDFRGWLELPTHYDQAEFARIKQAAKKIQSNSDVLICIGIGGSYLGAQAAVEFLNSNFYGKEYSTNPLIVFCGNSLSGSYLHDLLTWLGDRDFSINVISKSGTTTEPSVAFRIFKDKLIKKYGKDEAAQRIYATTDKHKGALKTEADSEGYEEFVVPDDVGGRYSVLSAVGLLPIATSGADIDALMAGARAAQEASMDPNVELDSPYRYAAIRNILYRKGYTTEIVENYEPNLRMFSEWCKQLMGESEGKDQKGIWPASANFTTDLHSIGQYIQEGLRNLFETVIRVKQPRYDVAIPSDDKNLDQLNFLAGKSLNYVNDRAYEGVVLAHTDGGVPVMTMNIADQSEKTLGYLIYFFELAIAISGYLNGINPFNQPGVEAYKRNMFGLLNKPGYENLHDKLTKRL